MDRRNNNNNNKIRRKTIHNPCCNNNNNNNNSKNNPEAMLNLRRWRKKNMVKWRIFAYHSRKQHLSPGHWHRE